MELERDFKGIWIPNEIWLDYRLNALDKIILMEIDSLDVSEEGCYASNKYLAEFCQCTETKISLTIRKLIELGYLEEVNFDGRRRYLKSSLKKNERQPLKKLKADFKKIKHINIDNNIDNNKEKYKKEKYYENEELNNLFVEFLDLRKKIKCKNTERAVKLLINELNKYDDNIKIQMLNNSIMNSWKSVYPIKQDKKETQVPEWFNKEYKTEYSQEAIEFEREVLGKTKR